MLALSDVTFFQAKFHCFCIYYQEQEQQLFLFSSLLHIYIDFTL